MDTAQVKKLLKAIEDVREVGFGEVSIIIQDGRILDIKKTTRERFEGNTQSLLNGNGLAR